VEHSIAKSRSAYKSFFIKNKKSCNGAYYTKS
jgi:hypothetical protein